MGHLHNNLTTTVDLNQLLPDAIKDLISTAAVRIVQNDIEIISSTTGAKIKISINWRNLINKPIGYSS